MNTWHGTVYSVTYCIFLVMLAFGFMLELDPRKNDGTVQKTALFCQSGAYATWFGLQLLGHPKEIMSDMDQSDFEKISYSVRFMVGFFILSLSHVIEVYFAVPIGMTYLWFAISNMREHMKKQESATIDKKKQ